MIAIDKKENCCGCEACVQICTKDCISFHEDSEGFRYPLVKKDNCTNCGLCEKVCPILHQSAPQSPLAVYAAKSKNEGIRAKSSSGGIFSLLAEKVIAEGGVVFAAKFNEDWNVMHNYTETAEELAPFRSSKYVQSRIGNSYTKIKEFLKNNRKVLFVGAPCQVAGLNRFLKNTNSNLLTVDFICHGVPSPMVWNLYKKEYLAEIFKNEKMSFTQINFRDKRNGWEKYGFSISARTDGNENISFFSKYRTDIFMRGFLADLYLRPSCHACPAKSFKSGSDLTIGDFWGIKQKYPDFYDEKGISLVTVNSEKGSIIYDGLQIEKMKVNERDLQTALFISATAHPKRELFFKNISENGRVIELINKFTYESEFEKKKKRLYKFLMRILKQK